MSRYGDRRRGMRRPGGNQTQDEYSKFRNDQGSGGSRRWDLSPAYEEQFGHQVLSGDRSHRERNEINPNRYQYYSGREEYPGPGYEQGFGRNRHGWSREDHDRDWNMRDRGEYSRGYKTGVRDTSEYGYGSGRSDMPNHRTWDQRGDESYNWGEHSSDAWTQSGQHRGKGPKGYKRLDERIREEINDVLSDDDRLDASDIVVSVQDGEVSLSGTVTDRASKRRAENLVEDISGVTNVENRIRIGTVTPEQPITREPQPVANGRSKKFQES